MRKKEADYRRVNALYDPEKDDPSDEERERLRERIAAIKRGGEFYMELRKQAEEGAHVEIPNALARDLVAYVDSL